MNEIQIRRIHIPDECWERTSQSWKALKPLRNFNELDENDETKKECYERLKNQFHIPLEVIEQWIYPHYYNINTINNYGWIDYTKCIFKKFTLEIEKIKSLNIIKKYASYVHQREAAEPFIGFMCIPKDKEHWEVHQTWRVPPIVIDVNSFSNSPDYSELSGPMQLVEGHSRMGYLLSMCRAGIMKKDSHEVYLLTMQRENV